MSEARKLTGATSLLNNLSPIALRAQRDESSLKRDSKYKKYAANVEKALAAFDAVTEWADYIAFLAKLQKSLQSHSVHAIPYGSQVSSCLAQCVANGLPSGVHQKTLEVYHAIFHILGPANLATELDIWLPGLLPLMPYASINVRMLLITLYSDDLLVLPTAALRSCLKPMLLALLAALDDDESTESYQATFKLIKSLQEIIADPTYFWQCFLLCSITSSDRRPGALAFALQEMPLLNAPADTQSKDDYLNTLDDSQKALVLPDSGILIRAFVTGLTDSQSLVQRGFLDLLLKTLQLHSGVLQLIVSSEDRSSLCWAAASVVLRKDMALNRRLWSWFLGPDVLPDSLSVSKSADYFRFYGLISIREGLFATLTAADSSPQQASRPFRICLSLMDRWELGGQLVTEIFMPLICFVRSYQQKAPPLAYNEVMKSANAFFDGVESTSIWGSFYSYMNKNLEEGLELLEFVVKNFNVRDEEMLVVHIPMMLLYLLLLALNDFQGTTPIIYQQSLTLLNLVPSRGLLPPAHSELTTFDSWSVLSIINNYYKDPGQFDTQPLSPSALSFSLVKTLQRLLIQSLKRKSVNLLCISTMYRTLLGKIPGNVQVESTALIKAISEEPFDNCSYRIIKGIYNSLITVLTHSSVDDETKDTLIYRVMKLYWHHLDSPYYRQAADAVADIWSLTQYCDSGVIQDIILSLFCKDINIGSGNFQSFLGLWNAGIEMSRNDVILAKPLLRLIDCLNNDDNELLRYNANLILDVCISGGRQAKLFNILLHPLTSMDMFARWKKELRSDDDIELLAYYLRTLNSTLCAIQQDTLVSLSSDVLIVEEFQNSELWLELMPSSDTHSYKNMLAVIGEATLSLSIPENSETEFATRYERLLLCNLRFLSTLLQRFDAGFITAKGRLEDVMISKLIYFVEKGNEPVQVALLDCLSLTTRIGHSVDPYSAMSKWRSKSKHANSEDKTAENIPMVQCIAKGISHANTGLMTEAWVKFVITCVPLLGENIFQILIPLEECFCHSINDLLPLLDAAFHEKVETLTSEDVMISLLSGLEKMLTLSYNALSDGGKYKRDTKSANEPGFFGNVISGVFSIESPTSRNSSINNRLTVLLSFQDVIKSCFSVWKWADQILKEPDTSELSYQTVSQIISRIRFKLRKLFEFMYNAETLETLEIFVLMKESSLTIKLLNILTGSQPKKIVPRLISSIYSRVQSSGSNEYEISTLTTDLETPLLMQFLVAYIESLENDAVEEVCVNCLSLAKDVANNIGAYAELYPDSLVLVSCISKKIESTLFGEQKKIRKEVYELIVKLIASYPAYKAYANSATKVPGPAAGIINESNSEVSESTTPMSYDPDEKGNDIREISRMDEFYIKLTKLLPNMVSSLSESEKLYSVVSTIISNVIQPPIKSRHFPENTSDPLIDLFASVVQIPGSVKAWKPVVAEAVLDAKFLRMRPELAMRWSPIIDTWTSHDREGMLSVLGKVTLPTINAANSLFGWSDGENQSRIALKRMALVMVLCAEDKFAGSAADLLDRLVALLKSSHVNGYMAEIYMCFRSVILRFSTVNLQSYWPIIYHRLQESFIEILRQLNHQEKLPDARVILMASKFLDVLLLMNVDDFQNYEWLFVNDTAEAMFRGESESSLALFDILATQMHQLSTSETGALSLCQDKSRPLLFGVRKIDKISELKSFFVHTSLEFYEKVYSLGRGDLDACAADLVDDILY
ncbi:hypothetical protein CANCADRAFT_1697 [Tortispora caseinolytica NRRL Y-17796]|uniref:Uncharacterized protein n=1 Tax=Tortispora caseinolytica NRRL Y-17796 TaxID=767744 RepID=A0A1E4TDW7_9ASCO|nr:hypothetical protein CANCADRAFT_1697 [Tortispora caseinolytica NRRL Y-17796]